MSAVDVGSSYRIGEVELGPLGDSSGFLLRLAQLRNFAAFFETFGTEGLKPGEFTVLFLLARNPGIRQGVLAEALSIKPSHMTKLVRAFEERGWVARHVPDRDRRTVELRLTPEGERFVRRHEARFLAFSCRREPALAAGEHEELLRLLRKLVGIEGGVR